MARITVEDCLEVVNNRFELVMMASKRARQLANGVQATLDNSETEDKPTVLALREIAARKIDNALIDEVEKAEARRARSACRRSALTKTCPRTTIDRIDQRFARKRRAGIGCGHEPRPHCQGRRSPTAAVPDYVLQLERAAHYLPPEQLPLLRRAWEVGASAHAGQTRKSGEPYITHPVAVARAAELGLDVEALIAAIPHDTIEDTPLTREALAPSSAKPWPNWSTALPSWTS